MDKGICKEDYDWVFVRRKWLSERSLYNSQVDENVAKRSVGKVFSLSEHVQGMIYSLLSNQRPWSGIIEYFKQIDDIFSSMM